MGLQNVSQILLRNMTKVLDNEVEKGVIVIWTVTLYAVKLDTNITSCPEK